MRLFNIYPLYLQKYYKIYTFGIDGIHIGG
jgi:hypothetical protein